jgi:hypothetical protein
MEDEEEDRVREMLQSRNCTICIAKNDSEDKHYLVLVKRSPRLLRIAYSHNDPFMFDNIDSFVELSRENTWIESVDLYPFDRNAGNYESWDKVGQMVGNLMELQTINIYFFPDADDDDDDRDEAPSPDWEIVSRVLRYLRRKIVLSPSIEFYYAEVEEIQGLARAIQGHPMISEFRSEVGFTLANMDPWCTALATLPSLERVTLRFREHVGTPLPLNLQQRRHLI